MGFYISGSGRIRGVYSSRDEWKEILPVTHIEEAEAAGEENKDQKQHEDDQEEKQKKKNLAVQQAKQIMSSPVVTLKEKTSIADAWKLFREKGFRHIPILSGEGKLIGLLSDRDILEEVSNKSQEELEGTPVHTIMQKEVLCADEQTNLKQIAEAFFQNKIPVLPIIDRKGHVIGMLTKTDVFQTILKVSRLDFWKET